MRYNVSLVQITHKEVERARQRLAAWLPDPTQILRGRGFVQQDGGLFLELYARERWRVQLRAEAFNVSNTPHFGNPGANVSNMILNPDGSIRSLGGYTEITTASAERQFRLALRLSF